MNHLVLVVPHTLDTLSDQPSDWYIVNLNVVNNPLWPHPTPRSGTNESVDDLKHEESELQVNMCPLSHRNDVCDVTAL